MSEQMALIPDLIRQSFSDPRGAAARIVRLDLPRNVLWEALALVVVLSVIASQLAALFYLQPGLAEGETGDPLFSAFLLNPFVTGLVQGVILIIMVLSVHWIGRAFGGVGRFEDAIALVVWLQFVLVCLQVVQAAAGLVSPALSGFIGLVGVGVFFWLLTQFVLVLHGFQSAGRVFVMIVVSMLGVAFALSMLVTVFGGVSVGEVTGV